MKKKLTFFTGNMCTHTYLSPLHSDFSRYLYFVHFWVCLSLSFLCYCQDNYIVVTDGAQFTRSGQHSHLDELLAKDS